MKKKQERSAAFLQELAAIDEITKRVNSAIERLKKFPWYDYKSEVHKRASHMPTFNAYADAFEEVADELEAMPEF